MATLNGSQGGYAGSCARKPPSLAVALNCGTDGLFFVDPSKALQAFDFCAGRFGDGIGKFGLTAARRPLKEDGPMKSCGQEHDGRRDLVGNVTGPT